MQDLYVFTKKQAMELKKKLTLQGWKFADRDDRIILIEQEAGGPGDIGIPLIPPLELMGLANGYPVIIPA